MAKATGADAPPVGVVIAEDDGSHSIWNGKQWLPAASAPGGGWTVDKPKMAAMGLGDAAGKLSPKDEAERAGLNTLAASTEGLASSAADFAQRNARTKTGGWLALPGAPTIAKALGIGGEDLAAMDRDSMGMATALRAPGQRLTQMEVMKNLGSGPTVRNDQPQNAQAVQQIYNGNTLAQAKAAFFSTYLDTHRTLNGVIPAWSGWKAQHFGPDGSYSHDPISHQQAAGMALKKRSTQGSSAPPVLDPKDYMQ